MKHILLAVAFSGLATTTPVLAQAEGVKEEFVACIAEMDQACLWSLGDQLTEAGGDADAAAGMIDSLTRCLTNPTPGCAERIKAQADQQAAINESNPVAAAMRASALRIRRLSASSPSRWPTPTRRLSDGPSGPRSCRSCRS